MWLQEEFWTKKFTYGSVKILYQRRLVKKTGSLGRKLFDVVFQEDKFFFFFFLIRPRRLVQRSFKISCMQSLEDIVKKLLTPVIIIYYFYSGRQGIYQRRK